MGVILNEAQRSEESREFTPRDEIIILWILRRAQNDERYF